MTVYEKFIEKSTRKHGDKFDYSNIEKSEYKRCDDKVCIKCPIHGRFYQRGNLHYQSKTGCPECSFQKTREFYTYSVEEFVELANKRHSHLFLYNQIEIEKWVTKEKINITCRKHGVFKQTKSSHLLGHGCPKCCFNKRSERKKLTEKQFLERSELKNVNFKNFDYSKVKFVDLKTDIELICKKHGSFLQKPYLHLRNSNCSKCHEEERKKAHQVKLIDKFNKIHNNKYDYSFMVFESMHDHVDVICPHHGKFECSLIPHSQGKGECPDCVKIERDQREGKKFLLKAKSIFPDFSYELVDFKDYKTKVKIVCKKHGEFEIIPDNFLNRKYACKKCFGENSSQNQSMGWNNFVEKASEIHNNRYHYPEQEYITSHDKINIKCKKHGIFTQSPSNHLYGENGCPSCRYFSSKAEKRIIEFIENLGFNVEINNRKILNGKEIDIYIEERNLAIEFNGIYWHSELQGKNKKYHLDKKNKAQEKDIDLIHIFEHFFKNKPEIVFSRIKNLLGKNDRKIYARKCVLKKVDKKTKSKFLIDNHLQGNCGSNFDIGLFYNDELVSLMSFCKKRKSLGNTHTDGHYELARFCNILNTSVVGGASKLLSFFEKEKNPSSLVSYADRNWSTGTLYKKIGFNFVRFSNPNYWYFKQMNVYHRYNFAKHMLKKKLKTFDKSQTEWYNMKENEWDRFWDCGNIVYEKKYIII